MQDEMRFINIEYITKNYIQTIMFCFIIKLCIIQFENKCYEIIQIVRIIRYINSKL